MNMPFSSDRVFPLEVIVNPDADAGLTGDLNIAGRQNHAGNANKK